MEVCAWCDSEYEYDDWIDQGEPECDEHGKQFCCADCLNEHMLAENE